MKEDLEMELSGLPPVDVLVNSAGVTHSGAFLETSSETFDVSAIYMYPYIVCIYTSMHKNLL